MTAPITFDFAPWRLSGVIVGTLLNDPAQLAALGDAVNAPPYKAPPRAPVLYVKPRNTLAASAVAVTLPADVAAFEVGASLGIVIGRAACRVRAADAPSFVAGWVLVADLCVPHRNYYRPNVRQRARDGSCIVGPVVPRAVLVDPGALVLQVAIDGRVVHEACTAVMQRPVAQLIQDVSEFMTLAAGDVLMLGVAAGAPQARAGQSFAVEAAALGSIEGRLVAEVNA